MCSQARPHCGRTRPPSVLSTCSSSSSLGHSCMSFAGLCMAFSQSCEHHDKRQKGESTHIFKQECDLQHCAHRPTCNLRLCKLPNRLQIPRRNEQRRERPKHSKVRLEPPACYRRTPSKNETSSTSTRTSTDVYAPTEVAYYKCKGRASCVSSDIVSQGLFKSSIKNSVTMYVLCHLSMSVVCHLVWSGPHNR